jgi:hypothetical protein
MIPEMILHAHQALTIVVEGGAEALKAGSGVLGRSLHMSRMTRYGMTRLAKGIKYQPTAQPGVYLREPG